MKDHPSGRATSERFGSTGQNLFSSESWEQVKVSLHLSTRELQVVCLIFDDHPPKVIAGKLGISEHTVHTHMERLFRKLDVTSRTAMILRIVAEHLLAANPNRKMN